MPRQPALHVARDHLRLARAEGVGPVAYRRLLRRCRSPAAALASLPELARAGGRAAPPAIPSEADADRELDRLGRMGGRLLVLDQPDYPPLLALLDDAPPVLFVLGDPVVLAGRAVALVGGRNASANGRRIAETLAGELAAAGFVIVSGLARGIDAAAHEGALDAGTDEERRVTGRTVAVIAGGLDQPYPPEHADLQRRIAETGAVVSEAPLGTVPQSRHFPRRNRVIAGLSLGVVVIEAAPRSGSLITARLAQEVGRELFAVPGSPLDPRARGSNDLIRQGAHLTESAADVLANLPDHPFREGLARDPLFAREAPGGFAELLAPVCEPENAGVEIPRDLTQVRSQVTELLGPSPTKVDDLVRRCQFPAAAVMAALLELELAGRIETLPGHRVALLAGHSPL
jgi:DNA processing protein